MSCTRPREFCWAASSLLEIRVDDENLTESKNSLNCYTLGEVLPATVAEYIDHNNRRHGGTTDGQLEYFDRLMLERGTVPYAREIANTGGNCFIIDKLNPERTTKAIRKELRLIEEARAKSRAARKSGQLVEAKAILQDRQAKKFREHKTMRLGAVIHRGDCLVKYHKEKKDMKAFLDASQDPEIFKQLYPAPEVNTLPILMPTGTEGELEDMFTVAYPV